MPPHSSPLPALIIAGLLFFALIIPVTATAGNITLTFRDLGFETGKEVQIYSPAGTLLNTTTTNGTVSLDGETSYLIVLAPDTQTKWKDPMMSLEYLLAGIPILIAYLPYIALAFGIAGVAIVLVRKL